jgi:SAM-dependent methyltransferase
MERAEQLREGVRKAYSTAAERPRDKHPFPVGRQFALSLGYPEEWLAGLPSVSTEAFSGVSNLSFLAEIPEGATVLDLGCGAGLDSLLAARRAGPAGKVIGIDFSSAMVARARQAAEEAGATNVEIHQADAEALPLKDASIDLALVNGIFNLNPARDAIMRELARVMRPGGSVYAAELVLKGPLSPEERASETNWFG